MIFEGSFHADNRASSPLRGGGEGGAVHFLQGCTGYQPRLGRWPGVSCGYSSSYNVRLALSSFERSNAAEVTPPPPSNPAVSLPATKLCQVSKDCN